MSQLLKLCALSVEIFHLLPFTGTAVAKGASQLVLTDDDFCRFLLLVLLSAQLASSSLLLLLVCGEEDENPLPMLDSVLRAPC